MRLKLTNPTSQLGKDSLLELTYQHVGIDAQPYQPFDSAQVVSPKSNDLMQVLGSYTSDHTQQSITAILNDQEGFSHCSVSGMTWNTLNFGHSIENSSHGYSNNPFNIEESFDAYTKRKTVQMEVLLDTIKNGELDFIFLQEAKFFSDDNLSQEVAQFKNSLVELGWDFSVTQQEDNSKHLLTLWNANTLKIEGSENILLDSHDDKFTGYNLNFIHIDSSQKISLVNLHLDYTKDYSQEILDFQYKQINNGIFTVMGGDTNHLQGFEQIGLLGHPGFASHISGQGDYKFDLDGSCTFELSTTLTINGDDFVRRYDGFFVNPSSDITSVLAIEGNGYYFHQHNDGSYQVKLLNPQIEYPNSYMHNLPDGNPFVGEKEFQQMFPKFPEHNNFQENLQLKDILPNTLEDDILQLDSVQPYHIENSQFAVPESLYVPAFNNNVDLEPYLYGTLL